MTCRFTFKIFFSFYLFVCVHLVDSVVQQTKDEKPKLSEQIDLEEAETALAGKDYKTARQLLEKLGKKDLVFM